MYILYTNKTQKKHKKVDYYGCLKYDGYPNCEACFGGSCGWLWGRKVFQKNKMRHKDVYQYSLDISCISIILCPAYAW